MHNDAAEQPSDTELRDRLRRHATRMPIQSTFGMALIDARPGCVRMTMPGQDALAQQHGYTHAGAIATLADTACGYAALASLPAGRDVLTVEFSVHLLRPARHRSFHATGRVVRAGRTLITATADVVGHGDGGSDGVAVLTATLMSIDPR